MTPRPRGDHASSRHEAASLPSSVEELGRSALRGDAVEVAPMLLGADLVAEGSAGLVRLTVTEVEAYRGSDDPASHAYRGPSARNAAMFGDAGHLYVYRHLGIHLCLNIVTGLPGHGAAVLLRAGRVIEGLELARARREARTRSVHREAALASGPANLAVCLGAELGWDGTDLFDESSPLRLEWRAPARPVPYRTGPRVGVRVDVGDPTAFAWRFWVADDPTVSRYRPAPVRIVRTEHEPSG